MKLIKDLGYEYPKPTSKQKAKYGIYECPICKTHFRTQQRYVNNGQSTKCKSCSSREINIGHGLESHELYGRWQSMKQRCYNPNNRDYNKYGAKGVTVCDEWKDDFMAYYTWCINNGYKETLFLDKDIKSNQLGITPIYSPDTCTFVTAKRNSQEACGVKVQQFDVNNNLIAEFNSYTEAARNLEKSIRKSIKKCCDGDIDTVEGFIWKRITTQKGT